MQDGARDIRTSASLTHGRRIESPAHALLPDMLVGQFRDLLLLVVGEWGSGQLPVRFALVERGPARQESGAEASLELVLATGERLRISTGADGATLRTVLDTLRV